MRVVHLFLIDTLLSTTAVQFGSRVISEVDYGDTILAGKFQTVNSSVFNGLGCCFQSISGTRVRYDETCL
jgi:hypothetical protein